MTDTSGLPSPDDPAAVDASTDLVHRVRGTVMPVLEVDLQPGQKVTLTTRPMARDPFG